jgi:hypothetical protein
VDSLHNQCLLQYDYAPITVVVDGSSGSPLFCSSWAVPPLLGIAYVILGYILPRVIEWILSVGRKDVPTDASAMHKSEELRVRAILAVSSTAAIIKLSEFLETHEMLTLCNNPIILDEQTNLAIMSLADAVQWIMLDHTPAALVTATITAVGGPLSELPFVANGFWHYNNEVANYLPLSDIETGGIADLLASNLLGDGYKGLALSSITGPCYFAVTMDAIALGRLFNGSTLDEGDKTAK